MTVGIAVWWVLWSGAHVYLGWRLSTLSCFNKPGRRGALVAILSFGWAAFPLGRILFNSGALDLGRSVEYFGAVWIGFLVVLLPALGAAELVTLFGLVLKRWLVPIRIGAVSIAAALAVVAWFGGRVDPRQVDVEVEIAGLPPAADGLVIAQLSDLHLGNLIGPRRLRRVIDLVAGMHPDVIAITGDLVDADADHVEDMLPQLRRLTAPDGVFAVLGNHEFYAGARRSRRLMRSAGFTVLDNAAVEIEPGVWLAGVPDEHGSRQAGREEADLGAALAAAGGGALVLLQHTPEHEVEAAAGGVGLMLNGHTHGAQIWPAHYLVKLEFPHLAGVRQVDGMTQIVNRGAGTWGPPMRLFAPAEIYRIVLRAPEGHSPAG